MRVQVALILCLLFVCSTAITQTESPQPSADTKQADTTRVPGVEWELAKPESMGYSTARLEALRAWVKAHQTTAMMVVVHGKVIFEYGDLKLASKVASVRKSVLSMLYGNYVASGKIDLGKTVKELGLDNKEEPFLPIEEHATLEQLLTARSGIYIASGNGQLDPLTPKRGSEYPGTHFVYNNWDFDSAFMAFERLTEKNVYDALQTDLAVPIGMQDYDAAQQKKITGADPEHLRFAMYLSTRDMARVGQLMLRWGAWNGKQVIPADWIRYSTSIITPFDELNPTSLHVRGRPDRWAYGSLWWVWDAAVFPGSIYNGPLQGAYSAMGAGGQYITVIPFEDMVIVHKVDIDKDYRADISPMGYDAILAMVLDSKCGGKCQ
jgi:CubicO group peptidase (beta-lactamase class C family)